MTWSNNSSLLAKSNNCCILLLVKKCFKCCSLCYFSTKYIIVYSCSLPIYQFKQLYTMRRMWVCNQFHAVCSTQFYLGQVNQYNSHGPMVCSLTGVNRYTVDVGRSHSSFLVQLSCRRVWLQVQWIFGDGVDSDSSTKNAPNVQRDLSAPSQFEHAPSMFSKYGDRVTERKSTLLNV